MESFVYNSNLQDLFIKFKTSENGLSASEVGERIKQFGENILPAAEVPSQLEIFFRQFANPLIYVLLIAGLIVFLLGEYIDAVAIVGVLLFNAIIGTLQEGKAHNALKALQNFSTTSATVLRDTKEIIIDSTDIVPGDIVFLRDGDKVPADIRLISANNLTLNEAALTGESTTVLKTATTLNSSNLSLADQTNVVFKSTYITAGTGLGLVVATGLNTVVGNISNKLKNITSNMPLANDLKRLSRVIIVGVVVINVFLFVIGFVYGNSLVQMFKTVVAVSVGLIPEGLPVVITLILVAGVWRMGKRNALVKRLQAVEALGQAKVIAVDKTGTITKNELMVNTLFVADKFFVVGGDGYNPTGKVEENGQEVDILLRPELAFAGKVATFCANAHVAYSAETKLWQIAGDPTEAALLVFGQKIGWHKAVLEKENPLLAEIPFRSDLKYHGTLHQTIEGNFFTKVGAPEVILDKAKYIWQLDGVHKLTAEKKLELKKEVDKMLVQGLRVLAFAICPNAGNDVREDNLPPLTFGGFFGMSDVIRPEVAEALFRARQAGIKVIMITGDHEATASIIAQTVGIMQKRDELISGRDLDLLSDIEFDRRLSKITVFARVTPEHKLRIIDAYKRRGEIVAMTGDGVNDALSLRAADLGVAMGRIGTDVAKEASDIILLDDNFGSIVSAIEEGRNIYRTIKKVILYLFSTSLSEVLVIIVAILLGWPLPLLASQIIWLNLVTDSFLIVALAVDPKDENLLTEAFIKPNKWFFDSLMMVRTILMTTVMTVGSLLVFWFYLPNNYGSDIDITKASTVILTALVLYQVMNIWNCRSEQRSIFKMKVGENKYILLSVFVVIIFQLAALYLPWFQIFLRTTPLSLFDWLIVVLISFSIVIVEEVRKLFYYYQKKISV